ncbi:hypothetical protein D9758_001662 [Tetrapyrgos nigripes]|uniref:DUF6534 domain-containing protein n=1 Tax=Tetrapyrgos nigripes TaxID=182062 RepID=A0A8H5GXW4_9AGAR|nr:hypothetical protein D9758_001662 [Tetrapyrgos nigripes]
MRTPLLDGILIANGRDRTAWSSRLPTFNSKYNYNRSYKFQRSVFSKRTSVWEKTKWVYTMRLLATVLNTHVARAAFRYFKNYPSDKPILKVLVGVSLFTGGVMQFAGYTEVYLYMITHWGDQDYLERQWWPVQVFLVSSAITVMIVQFFLIHRHWNLSRNVPISVVLSVLVLTAFSGSISVATVIVKHPRFEQRHFIRVPVFVWLLAQSVTDIAIAAALVVQLNTLTTLSQEAESIVRRLVRQSIQTGSITSCLALSTLIVYIFHETSNIETALTWILTPLYLATLFANLNSRQVDRSSNSRGLDDLESSPRLDVNKRLSLMSFQGEFKNAYMAQSVQPTYSRSRSYTQKYAKLYGCHEYHWKFGNIRK